MTLLKLQELDLVFGVDVAFFKLGNNRGTHVDGAELASERGLRSAWIGEFLLVFLNGFIDVDVLLALVEESEAGGSVTEVTRGIMVIQHAHGDVGTSAIRNGHSMLRKCSECLG